jgi:hypothetical protein
VNQYRGDPCCRTTMSAIPLVTWTLTPYDVRSSIVAKLELWHEKYSTQYPSLSYQFCMWIRRPRTDIPATPSGRS